MKYLSILSIVTLSLTMVSDAEERVPNLGNVPALPRIHPEALRETRTDLEKIRADRIDPKSSPNRTSFLGLNDYSAILHAHADDASHTGGTREELLADAKRTGLDIVMLSDHYRPPRDFMDSWRGIKDGVLFIPGSEAGGKGVLLYPDESIMDHMEGEMPPLLDAATEGTGMVFLSHVENRPDTDMAGYTGMEIYNRHADANDDMMLLMSVVQRITKPEGAKEFSELLKKFPEEIFASQLDYPALYLKKWDDETQHRRLVGIAANDCHHNQVFSLKMKDENTAWVGTNVDKDEDKRELTTKQYAGLKEHFANAEPGDVLVELDFDPYWISTRNVRTHILAEELTEPSVRKALKAGHAYVSHEWMADPTGFDFALFKDNKPIAIMGDEVAFEEGLTIEADAPHSGFFRLIRNGVAVQTLGNTPGSHYYVDEPGVYRIEVFLDVAGEYRLWILSNPIYVR